jgi:fructosamine-3-kinase
VASRSSLGLAQARDAHNPCWHAVNIWGALERAIGCARGRSFRLTSRRRLASGCGNATWRIAGSAEQYFVKLNRTGRAAMFAAEAEGLAELDQAVGLRVPRVIARGVAGPHAFLVLEYIALQTPNAAAMTRLGEALADMHGIITARHGWHRDNTIGHSPQHNAWHPRWFEFWRENRLAVMLDALAPAYPTLAREGEALLGCLDKLLAGHAPEPSLLHGDLWGGNIGMDRTGAPVIFDPAVYYGDRETDLAMTELFGGFSPLFFEAYWGAWPMNPGYREIRRPLYQLYHLLNHVRLFGGHYIEAARQNMAQLQAAV